MIQQSKHRSAVVHCSVRAAASVPVRAMSWSRSLRICSCCRYVCSVQYSTMSRCPTSMPLPTCPLSCLCLFVCRLCCSMLNTFNGTCAQLISVQACSNAIDVRSVEAIPPVADSRNVYAAQERCRETESKKRNGRRERKRRKR